MFENIFTICTITVIEKKMYKKIGLDPYSVSVTDVRDPYVLGESLVFLRKHFVVNINFTS